jgi:hypothetical protein
MNIRLVLLVAVMSGTILSCASKTRKRDQLVGRWGNWVKCLVSRMEFRGDGTVRYETAAPHPREGTWRFTDERKGILELTPQPLFVYPKPLPRGEIQVAFEGNDLVINGDGPATATKPAGGRFYRIE